MSAQLPVFRTHGSIYEQGRSVGCALSSEVEGLTAAARHMIQEHHLRPSDALKTCRTLVGILDREAPQAAEELHGIADGAGWSLDQAMLYNNWNYVVEFPHGDALGCTARLALSSATSTASPILGKNKDYPYRFGSHMHAVQVARSSEGYSLLAYGVKGWVGCDHGVNERGLCVVLTWVGTPDRGMGVQSHILTKLLLRNCASVGEAVEYLYGIPRTGMCNFMILDGTGKAIVFENGHLQTSARTAERDLLVCTNHFVSEGMVRNNPKLVRGMAWRYASTRARYERALAMLEEARPRVSVETMKEISRDHEVGPSGMSVCAHAELNGWNGGSVGAFIYDAGAQTVLIANGRPCETEYREVPLSWGDSHEEAGERT